ncbi:MAG: GcvT family protein, partial [Acetobacteraceae bacterium]
VTEPFPGLAPGTPVLRDPDHCAYFKEDAGKLLIGAFEPQARPWAVDGIPEGFEFGELAGDFDRFLPILEAAMARVPALREVGLRQFFTGPESFTPDVRYMLGETAEVRGLFVACGFNSTGIQSAGGAGKALAEWIVGGAAPMDLSDVDVRRFQPFQAISAYVAARAAESLGLLYAMHWPGRQAETARGVRVSPFHERLAVRGACFGEVAGWERVEWFAPAGTDPAPSYSYGRAAWFPYAAAEHRAAQEGCALFDLTAGGRFLVQGEGALALLEAMSTAALDVPAGTLVSTLWLDDRGGIEADVAVLRLAERSFLVLGAAAAARRDLALLEAAALEVAHAVVSEVSGGYAVLGLAGPRTGALLASLGVAMAEPGTAREVALGMAPVRVLGGGPAGTEGCTILIPAEFGAGVLDTLFAAGERFGLVPGGAQALESLRVEAGGPRWGREMTIETRPGEVGLAGRVAMAKPGGFRGRAALEAPSPWPARRLLWFRIEDPAPLLFQDEPVWRVGRIVGRITSGAYGHRAGAAVGLGLVVAEHAAAPEAGGFEIEIAGQRFAARARSCQYRSESPIPEVGRRGDRVDRTHAVRYPP